MKSIKAKLGYGKQYDGFINREVLRRKKKYLVCKKTFDL
jgi:hypothetical protein